ncbi:hypothetical protein ACQP2U_32175 [Nocardia sp. CA-084685]|uniref:hypothetical protein n=1 Tax=Nocardia sp. CA-084685 TaxID=3239970 RepID=UPI003D96285C
MSQNSYPYLGFNPVPGAPDDVAGLRGQISTAAEAVKETNQLLNSLRNSNENVWQGEGGDAFRANFDATLAQDLGYAQNSLEKAVGLLAEWHTDLVGFQDTAKGLEAEAAEAKGQYNSALQTLQQARSNTDLGLGSMTFTDPVELQAAQTRLNAATAQVNAAVAAVNTWEGNVDSIIRRARDLESTHDSTARRIASELDAAAKDFAPSPPDKSIWDRITDAIKGIGQWISDHREQIHDVLAGITAVTGLLALVTPPPADAIFAGIALVAGVGVLAMDALDPEVRDALEDVFSGDFNSDALEKIGMTVGLDSLGVIPGVGGAVKGVKAFTELGEFAPAIRSFTEGAQAPGIATKLIDGVPNVVNKIPLMPSAVSRSMGDFTSFFEDFGQASRLEAGTSAAGIELFSRAGKAGLGLFNIGNIGNG